MSLSVHSGVRRTLATLLALTIAATSWAGLATSGTAQAATRPTPGDFTGFGFDQCEAPSQTAMDAWLSSSPFWAVGIYIAGGNRACKEQRNLTPTWVSTQLANGWKLLPITVGPQASCYTNPQKKIRIKTDPAGDYAAARAQARSSAAQIVAAATALGISPGSALWYDLEHAAGLLTQPACRRSTLRFLDEWTTAVHEAGYLSGLYAHPSSGVPMMDRADAAQPGRFAMPDYLWFARWDGVASIDADPAYLRPTSWMPHARVHQYRGDHVETHGGVSINIDSNYMSLGRGTRPGRSPRFCGGVQVDFPTYPRLAAGATRPEVTAAQCLLRRQRVYDGPLTGTVDAATRAAVVRYQQQQGLAVTGRVNARTWTDLHSAGGTPLLKYGSGGKAVRRVQRALNAAARAGLTVDGLFFDGTTQAVKAYQSRVGLTPTGVVNLATWTALQAGRR